MEINRLIRVLSKIADNHSGADLFVKIYDEAGDFVSPDKDEFEFDNDQADRIIYLNGK